MACSYSAASLTVRVGMRVTLTRSVSEDREPAAPGSALAGLGGLLQQPADGEDQSTAGSDHERVFQSHFFRPNDVAGNSNRANQQSQELQKSGNFVEHELFLSRGRLAGISQVDLKSRDLG